MEMQLQKKCFFANLIDFSNENLFGIAHNFVFIDKTSKSTGE